MGNTIAWSFSGLKLRMPLIRSFSTLHMVASAQIGEPTRVPRLSVSDAASAAPSREPVASDVVARRCCEGDERGSLARDAAETRASTRAARVEVARVLEAQ